MLNLSNWWASKYKVIKWVRLSWYEFCLNLRNWKLHENIGSSNQEKADDDGKVHENMRKIACLFPVVNACGTANFCLWNMLALIDSMAPGSHFVYLVTFMKNWMQVPVSCYLLRWSKAVWLIKVTVLGSGHTTDIHHSPPLKFMWNGFYSIFRVFYFYVKDICEKDTSLMKCIFYKSISQI